MKQKKLETLLYSAVGIVAMALILVAVNYIAATFRSRVDLTADKLYTLSDGTKKIVGKLDTKVKIRLYYSQRDNAMPVFLKTYAQRVEDLLVELKQQSKFIEIEKLDPQPDSDAEDSANLDGVEGQPTQTGEKIYLGISINCLDQKVALPFLSPEREKLLEYDLARAIARVANPTKPVVGVMSALPIFGTPMNPMMMRMGQQGGQQPAWYLISELKNDFDVQQLEMNVTEIPATVKVLLVVHPRDITDATQFAIDQFVLRGGKLIAFLDPVSYVDQQRQGGNPMMGGGPPTSSSLDKLLGAWGIGFDKTKCVADMKYVTRMGRGQRVEQQPAVLSLSADAIDRNDIATSQVDSLMMGFTGAFTGSPVEGLKKTDLIKSTTQSQLVEGFLAQMSGEAILKDFKPSSTEYALAIKLSGKFKTAFPNGKPDAAPPAPGEEKKEVPKGDALKEAKEDNHVILVADADMLNDNFCVQIQDFFGQRVVIPRNGNVNLAQNFVEQMSGDTALMNTRSRAIVQRQFTRVRDMQLKAEDAYRAKIKTLEDSLQETQRKLNELQRNKEKGQRFVMSPEQQKELENFRKKEAEVKVELKLLRRDLRQEVESMENRLKWMNIAGMPFLVTIGGIGLAVFKRKRTAAR
ncbi:MAG: ABC transporter [Limisphaerales bacterium]|nr:MAG: ABC transporter [Limisphaerales bacterium]KAG0506877.1 MAG: ABC transporter [Limisphaerales bacterium]TXT46605.1 MAG: ABC transporter [Limisphaerales bacterium]